MGHAARLVIASCLVAALPHLADACTLELPLLRVDAAEQAIDHQAPAAPVVRGASIAPHPAGGSCADLDVLRVVVEPGLDDRSTAAELGYRLELVSGRLPDGVTLPLEPIRTSDAGGEVRFVWSRAGEPVSITLRVTAVDRAGNQSPPVLISVDEERGCSVSGRAASPAAALLLVAAALLTRRRASSSGG